MTNPPPPYPLETAQQEYLDFWASISPNVLPTLGIYVESMSLLRDVIVAAHAQAMGASMLACRATIESACYTALSSVRIGPGGYRFDWPVDLSGKVRRVEFEEVKDGVASRGILPPDLLRQVDEVQKHGNFIAHVATKNAAQLQKVVRFPKQGEGWRRMWVTVEEVRAALDCAKAVLRTLMEWSNSQPVQPLHQN